MHDVEVRLGAEVRRLVHAVQRHDAEGEQAGEEEDDDADEHDDELLARALGPETCAVRHLAAIHGVHRHLHDDARVQEDQQAHGNDKDDDEASDDVAVLPDVLQAARAHVHLRLLHVVVLAAGVGDGQEGCCQCQRHQPHDSHQHHGLKAAFRGVHPQRVAHGVVALEADTQNDEDGCQGHCVL